MTISQSNAEQIGVILETMAYGVYLAIFVQCLNVLRKRHAYQKPASYLLITAVTLFVLVTMHLTMDLVRSMEATQTNSARGAELYYEDLATWKNVFKTGCYVAATVVSDAFILYRCFVVWGRNYFIVVIPILLFIADVVSGVLFCTTLNKANKNLNFAELEMALQFYSITLTLNSMCTLLIAWRIWKLQKTLAPYSTFDRELKRVAVLIVESGAVYSAWLFIQIGTYAGHSPAMFIFLNSMSPIIGIVFSAVIVRIGLGLSAGDDRPLHASTRDMRFTTHTGGAVATAFLDLDVFRWVVANGTVHVCGKLCVPAGPVSVSALWKSAARVLMRTSSSRLVILLYFIFLESLSVPVPVPPPLHTSMCVYTCRSGTAARLPGLSASSFLLFVCLFVCFPFLSLFCRCSPACLLSSACATRAPRLLLCFTSPLPPFSSGVSAPAP